MLTVAPVRLPDSESETKEQTNKLSSGVTYYNDDLLSEGQVTGYPTTGEQSMRAMRAIGFKGYGDLELVN